MATFGTGGREALFRPQAVAAAARGNIHDDALRVMRPRLWGSGAILVAVLAGAVAWSAVFAVPVTVVGQGIVLSAGRVIDVVADAAGQVHELNVRPGDEVTAGLTVARISQPDLRLQLSVARGELADAERFQAELAAFQQRDAARRSALREARSTSLAGRLAALEEQRKALLEQQAGLDMLFRKGTTTRDRLIAARDVVLAVDSQIAGARDEQAAIATEAGLKATEDERAMLDAQRQVAEARRQVAGLEEQLERRSAVVSPFAGHVVEAKANVGQMVEPGTAILAVERASWAAAHGGAPGGGPAGLPVVIAYVKAADGKKVAPGMPVEVSPSTTRREQDGFIRGRVLHVAEIPATSAGMMRTLQNDRLVQAFVESLSTPFEIGVALEADPSDPARPLWSGAGREPPRLVSGTLADVRVTIGRTTLLALAIPALKTAGAEQAW